MAPQTFFNGEWLEGNPGIFGPMTHATWLGSCVFDGARALRRRGARSRPALRPGGQVGPVHGAEPVARRRGHRGPGRATASPASPRARRSISGRCTGPKAASSPRTPDSTRFAISVYEAALPDPAGASAIISSRRPADARKPRPTEAKAACLYPQSGMALREGHRPRLPERRGAGPDGQCGGVRHRQFVLRPRRGGVHPGAQWLFPGRHHPPPHHRAAARRTALRSARSGSRSTP